MKSAKRPLIDAHLDLAMNVVYYDRDIRLPLDELNERERGLSDLPFRGRATLSLPELRDTGVAVCFATVLCRSGPHHRRRPSYRRSDLDFPVREAAWAMGQAQLSLYRLLEEEGELKILRSVADLEQHWQVWQSADQHSNLPIGIVITMEGADAVLRPEQVEAWYRDGVRAIGPAHYGYSHYAAGTNAEGGWTPAGLDLLTAMRECGMILELTHLSDEAMTAAFDIWDGPVWATHHNCRRLVPWQRQLTDEQIRLVHQRGGLIGAACDAVMLDAPFAAATLERRRKIDAGTAVQSPAPSPEVSMSAIVDHMELVRELAGTSACIGIGTDLDGGYGNEQTPTDLRRYRDLRLLEPLLADRGFSESEIDGVFYENWLRKLRECLPPA